MPSGATAENSSTRTRVGQRVVLLVGGDGEEVLDDRGGEHRREQRTAVGVQAEVDDLAGLDRAQQVDARPARVVRLQPWGDV